MNRASSVFLRAVVVAVGLGALAFLLWEPHVEGRNANATTFEIYFRDPFLAFVYVGSIPFFVALYQAFRVLGNAGSPREFSPAAVKSLRTIKRCAFALVGFVAVGEIIILSQTGEDRAGGIAMGLFIAFGAIVVATAVSLLERAVQAATELKSEHDLTV